MPEETRPPEPPTPQRQQFYKERARKGAEAVNNAKSGEERSLSATNAAMARWAMYGEIGQYPLNGQNVTRVNAHLRRLDRLIGKHMLAAHAGDPFALKEVRACIAAMLGYERLRIWIEMNAGKPNGPALEVGAEDEQAKRLREARERRNKALGLEEGETVVTEVSNAKDGKQE